MNMAERIQHLRKSRGFSQEELADRVGVSRQAVSKWESGQSMPDLEKVISMSELFGVTTDYILRGSEGTELGKQNMQQLASKVLYILSTTLVFIGLVCAFAGWYEKQTMDVVAGGMVIQAVGIASYFIGGLLSKEQASFYVKWFNAMGILFMPFSMITGMMSTLLLGGGWVAPYPVDIVHISVFGVAFSVVAWRSFVFLKKRSMHK